MTTVKFYGANPATAARYKQDEQFRRQDQNLRRNEEAARRRSAAERDLAVDTTIREALGGGLGDLKRELLDLWTEERNTYAKAVMLNIEKQRKGATR